MEMEIVLELDSQFQLNLVKISGWHTPSPMHELFKKVLSIFLFFSPGNNTLKNI